MADIVTISVSMPAEMQRLIGEQVRARFFGNISEYFRHLVRQDLERTGPLAPATPGTGSPDVASSETPGLPHPRLFTLSLLREAGDAQLTAWARELAKNPAESRRPLGRWLIAAERIKDELERRDLPMPPGHPLVPARPVKPAAGDVLSLKLLVERARRVGDLRSSVPFNIEDLRRLYPVATIERLLRQSEPGSSWHTNLGKLLRVLRGELTKKESQNVWTVIDLDFLEILRLRYGLGGDPDELGGAPVPKPTPPKPKSGSARAKPPHDADA